MRIVAPWLCVLLAAPSWHYLEAQETEERGDLKIVVLEGEGSINNIRLKRAKEPIVQVLWGDKPAKGAAITFQLPATGAGGTFGGNSSLTMMSDEEGRAIGRGLQPNRNAGPFEIRVSASLEGQTATAVITQTNAEPTAKRNSGKLILILALAGGAIAGGVAAAAGGGGGSATPAPAPGGSGTVITPGTPTIGPPQ